MLFEKHIRKQIQKIYEFSNACAGIGVPNLLHFLVCMNSSWAICDQIFNLVIHDDKLDCFQKRYLPQYIGCLAQG